MLIKVIITKNTIFNSLLSTQCTVYKHLKHIYKLSHFRDYSTSQTHNITDEKEFKLRNVLLIRKITRYEYERQLLRPISHQDFKNRVSNLLF